MDYTDYLPQLNKTEEKFREKVQSKVKYCVTCQPYDGGDYIWIMGEKTTLEEIFDDLNVPERYRENISSHISCDNCGASNFERYDIVGTEDRFDLQTKEKVENAEKRYGKQIDEFETHLERHPTLGLLHTLGKKIFKEIRDSKVPVTTIEGNFFRGRIVTESKVYDCSDLDAPPTGKAGDGRYHHSGQSVLYLADSEDTAVSEVIEDYYSNALVWLQQYKLESVGNILDLKSNWDKLRMTNSALLVALLSRRLLEKRVEDRQNKWKPEYFITRFIADCARNAGFDGIMYSSTRGYGENVVLFTWDQNLVKPIGNPKIYIHNPRQNPFKGKLRF